MKRTPILSLLAWLACQALPAQEIDVIRLSEPELRSYAQAPSTPEALRLDALNELAFRFRNIAGHQDTARQWALEALALARRLPGREREGDALTRLGLIADAQGQLDSAVYFFEQALAIRTELGLKRGAANIYNNLGNLLKRQEGGAEKAIAYFRKGLETLAAEDGNPDGARLHNNLGGLYTTTGAFGLASHHLERARAICDSLNNPNGRGLYLINKGIYYQALGNHTAAEQAFREALLVFQQLGKEAYIAKCLNSLGNHHFYMDSFALALDYYNQALQLESLEADDLASIIRNKGAIYTETGQLDKALENFNEGLEAFTRMGDKREMADIYFNLGLIYAEKGDYDAAIRHYETSLDMLQSLQLPSLKSDVLLQLSIAYQERGELQQALRCNSQYFLVRDSIQKSLVAGLNQEVNLVKSHGDLLLELSEKQKQTIVYYGLIGFLIVWLLFLGAALYAYITRKRQQIAQLELEEAVSRQELDRAYAYIEGQDEERQRIGEDLHDRLGSMLSMVKLNFAAMDTKMESFQAENRQNFEKANELLDHACDEVRQISYNLQSGIIAKFGLKAQLEAMAEDLQETGQMEVELSTHGLQERLNNKLEIQIYRIFQELVNNIIKHARARKISLQANRFDSMVNIMVEDDGQGFDPDRAGIDGGMGLKNVESRVNKLDGEIKIASTRGRGATIMIDIPIQEE